MRDLWASAAHVERVLRRGGAPASAMRARMDGLALSVADMGAAGVLCALDEAIGMCRAVDRRPAGGGVGAELAAEMAERWDAEIPSGLLQSLLFYDDVTRGGPAGEGEATAGAPPPAGRALAWRLSRLRAWYASLYGGRADLALADRRALQHSRIMPQRA